MDKFTAQHSSPSHYRVLTLKRSFKKAVMVLADIIALPFALWSGYALRLADWWPEAYLFQAVWLFILMPFVGVLLFMKLGLYRAVVRFMGAQAIFAVTKGVAILAILLWAASELLTIQAFPRSVPVIFALVALVYVGGSRLLVRSYYHWLLKHYLERRNVLVYGAGGSGVQLTTALSSGAEYFPVGFLDDDKTLWGGTVNGYIVYNPARLSDLIDDYKITHILLALPEITHAKRKLILERIAEFPVHVKTMPSMPEIISGESLDSLREIEIEDLLGRDEVPPDDGLLQESITDKVVLVSGAGGSIGSEICRQAIRANPSVLVLYEMNEYSLYKIEQELIELLAKEEVDLLIFPVLGSVLDKVRISKVIRRFSVNTIYHAAAYKHVPMVEHNIFEGITNNALGTKTIAESARDNKVERFVLISTDKAVRPTNIMGASKRLAELILQDLAVRSNGTIFSMVRFGNVLGSSGSVVPLFRKQIESGGPVTVTHPEITRFFMTIPEAASLVIQAGSMASGGDVFVLDMGLPVKITELAERMIKLMGAEVRSDSSSGGIELIYNGLRPGEKLYEELLIGDNVSGTSHKKILRAEEDYLAHDYLQSLLDQLVFSMDNGDTLKTRNILQQIVSDYTPSTHLVDWLQDSKNIEM
ncbi:polysaccharide biosynthesis protein [Aliamphritea ceti]|uniref:polysaccharide biosynthesis protein n=1 Tax=Aliamphritea ceti TaxID=1524258 RepID=UPI0021C38F14|nr:nucleoside-diphosphate sugar epimerase/dehydratase [Aliamphritea ceti]